MKNLLPAWIKNQGVLPLGDLQVRHTAWSGYKASKAAEEASKNAMRMSREQLKWEKERAAKEDERRAWFDNIFRPGYRSAVDEAMRPTDEQPGYLAAIGQYERGMGDVSGSMCRTMGGRYSTGSGAERATARRVALEAPRGRASIRSDYDQARFQNLMAALGLGGGTLNQSYQHNVGGAYGNMANMFSNRAGQLQQQAAGSWNALGSLAGAGMNLYGQLNAPAPVINV